MATLAILDTNDFIIQQNPTPTLFNWNLSDAREKEFKYPSDQGCIT